MASEKKTATRDEETGTIPGAPAPRGSGSMARHSDSEWPSPRVTVNKAYKMYVGGAFIRSESGRYFQVSGAKAVARVSLLTSRSSDGTAHEEEPPERDPGPRRRRRQRDAR